MSIPGTLKWPNMEVPKNEKASVNPPVCIEWCPMSEHGGPHEWAAPTVGAGRDGLVVVTTHMVAPVSYTHLTLPTKRIV